MKNLKRRVGMIFGLAMCGVWPGAWCLTCELVWALCHRKCRQCGLPKPDRTRSMCADCILGNMLKAMGKDFPEGFATGGIVAWNPETAYCVGEHSCGIHLANPALAKMADLMPVAPSTNRSSRWSEYAFIGSLPNAPRCRGCGALIIDAGLNAFCTPDCATHHHLMGGQ